MTTNSSLRDLNESRAAFAKRKLDWGREWFMAQRAAGKMPTVSQINHAIYRAFGQGIYSSALYKVVAKWRDEPLPTGSVRLPPPPKVNSDMKGYIATIIETMRVAGIEKLLVTPDGLGGFSVDAEVQTKTTAPLKLTITPHD